MHTAALMPCDQHLVLAEMGAHKITRLRHLAFVGDVNPEAPEDALLFQCEHVGIGVGAAMDDVVVAHKSQYVIPAQALRSGSGHRGAPWKMRRRSRRRAHVQPDLSPFSTLQLHREPEPTSASIS